MRLNVLRFYFIRCALAFLLTFLEQLSKAASTEALEALAAAAPEGAVDVSTAAAEKAAMRGQEAVSSLYTELASRGLLRGFGAVGAGDEPFPKRPLVAADLPKLIGLEQVNSSSKLSQREEHV